MNHLGDFGAAQHELSGETDDFDFFGETFTVVAPIPSMLMLQLAAAATGKIDESEGMAAMWEALRCSLTKPAHTDPDGVEVEANGAQFNRLYKLAVDKNCDIESVMRLVFALFEAQGGRPTRPVSASSTGLSPTSQKPSMSSTHPAFAHLRPVDEIIRGEVVAQTG